MGTGRRKRPRQDDSVEWYDGIPSPTRPTEHRKFTDYLATSPKNKRILATSSKNQRNNHFAEFPTSPTRQPCPNSFDYHDDSSRPVTPEPACSSYNDEDIELITGDEETHPRLDSGDESDNSPKKKRERGPSAVNQFAEDINEQELFLQEYLRLEGRGDSAQSSTCAECGITDPAYRCQDCNFPELLCRDCIRQTHKRNYLHRIQYWNGQYFERTTLKTLGLFFQLNHPTNQPCTNPRKTPWGAFIILGTNAVHEVDVRFCTCPLAPPGGYVQQLLRARLFPNTSTNPRSATTFNSLKQYHLLSFEGQISQFAYYYALARSTDNTTSRLARFDQEGFDERYERSHGRWSGEAQAEDATMPELTANPPRAVELDMYSPFRTMVRKYRFIKMALRAGKGHDPGGMWSMKPGELAVQCPACPRPSINLPDDWASLPPEIRWLYTLFLAMDGNFRVQGKNISSEELDRSLLDGHAYTVEWAAFKKFLEEYEYSSSSKENPCVSHKAVRDADTKSKSGGLRATGLGSVDCARHEMKRPLACGDFQVGERYRNMDYFLWSSLRDRVKKGSTISISYDVSCQWSVNMEDRLYKTIPLSFQPVKGSFDTIITVPAFHSNAHIERCRNTFGCRVHENIGRSEGETPERQWRYLDLIASSLREMGPGARFDTLNDFIGDWNWKKENSLDYTLLRKIKVAVPESRVHVLALQEYEDVLNPVHVAEWKRMMAAWQKDKTQLNPFESKCKAISEQAVRLRLLQNEEQELSRPGATVLFHGDVSPSEFIATGIDIENLQRRHRWLSKNLKEDATFIQKKDLVSEAAALRKKMNGWFTIQESYCPIAAALRAKFEDERGSVVHEIPLYLPSEVEQQGAYNARLVQYEWAIREARLSDALTAIRTHIAFISALFKHKDRFARGQRANTRSNNSLQRAYQRLERLRAEYNESRRALLKLQPMLGKSGSWQGRFQHLKKGHIRTLNTNEALFEPSASTKKPANGNHSGKSKTLSWIWSVQGVADEAGKEEDQLESLRIAWCRARMRAHSWSGEVRLLREEMRRTILSFEHDVHCWESRAAAAAGMDESYKEGARAYAFRHAAIKNTLLNRCKRLWHGIDEYITDNASQINEEYVAGTLYAPRDTQMGQDDSCEDDPFQDEVTQGSISGTKQPRLPSGDPPLSLHTSSKPFSLAHVSRIGKRKAQSRFLAGTEYSDDESGASGDDSENEMDE